MDAVIHTEPGSARRPRRFGRIERGMSMIEVMVALAILASGLLAMLAMQVSALKQGSRGRHSTDAAQIAQDQMEVLQSVGWATIPPAAWTAPVNRGITNPVVTAGANAAAVAAAVQQFQVSWRVRPFPGAATELRFLDVTVTWNEVSDPPGMPPRRYAISAIRHDDPGLP